MPSYLVITLWISSISRHMLCNYLGCCWWFCDTGKPDLTRGCGFSQVSWTWLSHLTILLLFHSLTWLPSDTVPSPFYLGKLLSLVQSLGVNLYVPPFLVSDIFKLVCLYSTFSSWSANFYTFSERRDRKDFSSFSLCVLIHELLHFFSYFFQLLSQVFHPFIK